MGSSLQSKPNRSTLLIRKRQTPNKGNNNNNNNYLAAQIDFRKIDKPPQPNLPLLPCRVASLALSRPSLRSIQTCTPSNVGDGITAVPSIRLYRIRHRPDPTRPWTHARQRNTTHAMHSRIPHPHPYAPGPFLLFAIPPLLLLPHPTCLMPRQQAGLMPVGSSSYRSAESSLQANPIPSGKSLHLSLFLFFRSMAFDTPIILLSLCIPFLSLIFSLCFSLSQVLFPDSVWVKC